MEIKTCEEYVLARLSEAEEQVASLTKKLADRDNIIKTLQTIFTVAEEPSTGELSIGVDEDKLNAQGSKDSLECIKLLKQLFMKPAGGTATSAKPSKAKKKGTTKVDFGTTGVPGAAPAGDPAGDPITELIRKSIESLGETVPGTDMQE